MRRNTRLVIIVALVLCGSGCLAWSAMNFGSLDWLTAGDFPMSDLGYSLVADQRQRALGFGVAGILLLGVATALVLRARKATQAKPDHPRV